MNGLAGPLHGLANQEVLRWIMDVMKDLGGVPTKEQLSKYLWDTLAGGKVIHPVLGSFVFIGVLLTDLELARDGSFEADRCGTCHRCLEACPTGAFPTSRVLDARRCISYLTIEARSPMPDDLTPGVGRWLFGCDVCQDVCPWNLRFAMETAEPRYRGKPADQWPTLEEIVRMTERECEAAFEGTALERAGRSGLARNAAVVLENVRAPAGSTLR